MKKFLSGSLLVCGAIAVAHTAFPVMKIERNRGVAMQEALSVKSHETLQKNKFYSAGSSLKADFTIQGAEAGLEDVYTHNFDNGYQGWTCDPTTHAVWSLKKQSSYSEIDPADVQSLFVEGDYRVYNREKSGAVSPVMWIPDNGVLSFYVYFSLNYDSYCRLELSLSSDGFEEENIVLWNSGSETGERTSCWRPVTINLSEYAGREVQFKFLYTYGSDDEIFKTGGYMGDFYIDGFKISGRKALTHIDVATGEEIHLMDITGVNVVSREWNMPGAVPSTSTEKEPVIYYTDDGTYDVSLTVTDADGNVDTKTVSGFVGVTGTAPVAKILPPATFHLSTNRLPLIAPLAPVTFEDASSGFPKEHEWSFTGVDADPDAIYTSTEERPEVSFAFLHDQKATLKSSNQHGESADELDFTVEYSGVINNLQPQDGATTFDMDDWGVFPGSNTQKFSKFAERFSHPSRPVMVAGAYVFFNRAEAGDLVDQLSSVGVHLYTSKDGLPDRRVDSWWWSVYELDTQNTAGETVGTPFPFTDQPFVYDEFFIVVDGIPAYQEAGTDHDRTLVSFLMAPFRDHGNTALFYKEKEDKWVEAADYFPAGRNHTSFYIMPQVFHSVMAPLTNDSGLINVGKDAGNVDFEIFSYLGRTATPEIDCGWLRLDSAPGEYTVDTLKISFDRLPDGLTERTGHIVLTDGASTLTLTVNQGVSTSSATVAVSTFAVTRKGDEFSLTGCNPEYPVEIFSLSGAQVAEFRPTDSSLQFDAAGFEEGVYLIINGKNTYKFIK